MGYRRAILGFVCLSIVACFVACFVAVGAGRTEMPCTNTMPFSRLCKRAFVDRACVLRDELPRSSEERGSDGECDRTSGPSKRHWEASRCFERALSGSGRQWFVADVRKRRNSGGRVCKSGVFTIRQAVRHHRNTIFLHGTWPAQCNHTRSYTPPFSRLSHSQTLTFTHFHNSYLISQGPPQLSPRHSRVATQTYVRAWVISYLGIHNFKKGLPIAGNPSTASRHQPTMKSACCYVYSQVVWGIRRRSAAYCVLHAFQVGYTGATSQSGAVALPYGSITDPQVGT